MTALNLHNLYANPSIIKMLCEHYAHIIPPIDEAILYDIAANYITESMVVLDVGCRDGHKTMQMHKRTNAVVVALDLMRDAFHDRSTEMPFVQADALFLPFSRATFDALWCIDMISHIEDVNHCFDEFARILKPGAVAIVYSMECSKGMILPERDYLQHHLALASTFDDTDRVMSAASRANFTCVQQMEIGAQWRESWEYSGEMLASKQLLRIAQLRRFREQIIPIVGEAQFHVEYARCMANIWHLMGYFSPVIWVFKYGGSTDE